MNVEEKKKERSRAKQQVKIASRKLTSAVDREESFETLKTLMIELDSVYDIFCDINEDYEIAVLDDENKDHRVVNGEDIPTYRAHVMKNYEDARDLFLSEKLAVQQIKAVTKNQPQSVPPVQDLNENVDAVSEDSLSSVQDSVLMHASTVQHMSSQISSVTTTVPTVNVTSLPSSSGVTTLANNFPTSSFMPYMSTCTALNNGTLSVQPSVNVPTYSYPAGQAPIGCSVIPSVDSAHINACQTPSNDHSAYVTSIAGVHQSPAYTTLAMGSQEQILSPSFASPQKSDVRLKKMSLPTFSGLRKDWPEFKTVWKQLAEAAYSNKTALAHELKRCVRGEATQRIKSVYVTRPEAYDTMWRKLEAYYDDTSATVQVALEDLHKLKPVSEGDYKALVEFVDSVESSYSQLEELDQLNTLTMRDVDYVNGLLPNHLKIEWIRKYHDMSVTQKIQPFKPFMKFLEREREAVARLAEHQSRRRRVPDQPKVTEHRSKGSAFYGSSQDVKKFYHCAFHRKDTIKHTTGNCKEFQKLSIVKKYEVLKQVRACFICFGDHMKQRCPNKKSCSLCGNEGHHPLLCQSTTEEKEKNSPNIAQVEAAAHTSQTTGLALYPIQQATVCGTGKSVTIFCDSGSDTSYITHRAADRIKAKKLKNYTLDVTTMGKVEKTYNTKQYEFSLKTVTGKKVDIIAYGMDSITGPVSQLDLKTVAQLFPKYDANSLQRKSRCVDILLGCDYFGLHPKKEEAKSGDHLSIMSGEFGVCLQGTNPDLREETRLDSNLVKTIHDYTIKTESHHVHVQSHSEFLPPIQMCAAESHMACKNVHEKNSANIARTDKKHDQLESFISGEELGTETTPRCGGCRCGKCPTTGHTYSFKEEQELKMIRENLEYDKVNQCWITSYPWLVDPSTLPDNYSTALATLKSTERNLKKDDQWAETYQKQVQDMVNRGVARKLSQKELQDWKGPTYYISHLAVVNTQSQSTPVRIVFNSSQVCKGISLNSCLAKGPDCYMNNLLGILLRWREEQVALVGDIRKMFNSVHIKPLEQHCHRFLWRDLETERDPDIYMMTRVNMGDTPAPAISTEAVYKTADLFKDQSPQAANLLKKSSYVDDLIDSQPSVPAALKIARETESMLAKGGFKVKCWQLTGESNPRTGEELFIEDVDNFDLNPSNTSQLKGNEQNLRVLGLGWVPEEDKIVYETTLNFSKKKKGVYTEQHLVKSDLPQAIPEVLTKRMVLGQVMKIYDPLGILCPFTLIGKVLLRETWMQGIGWDDRLPDDLRCKWITFFTNMFQMESLKFERCLRPADAQGNPWLVILSDGSDLAYGFVAYARWRLQSGSYSCRLIMAKNRIAPINKLSTPQMELNAAVLSKRGRKVIEKEMRFEFDKVLHVVDSETVLNMVNKTSTRFKVYEGVRVGEIQAATDGDMSDWAWMSGRDNTADWLTRGRLPQELNSDSRWWKGPPVLARPMEEWGLKFGLQKEGPLPGEKKSCGTVPSTNSSQVAASSRSLTINASLSVTANSTTASTSFMEYNRFSDINRVIWIVARLMNIARKKSFSRGKSEFVSAQHLKLAENFIVKDVQKSIESELMKNCGKKGKGGRFAALKPVQDADGIWVVGQRLTRFNAMTPDSRLQKLLPNSHQATRLFMERAHKGGHRGRDATLARFRMYFWVPQGSKLAKAIKQNCQLCKLRDAKFLEQEMGLLPEARLKPSPPFNFVMIDLFGPYAVRGEVQKRVSGKAYGVLFTDLTMRAVHIEAVFGYDTSSFLMALSRFTSLRGWPEKIYSDPGSQLVGAERELKQAWQKIDHKALNRNAVQNGTTWVFGPADSSWHQGAAESLIKTAKRAIHFAVHNQRLSPSEFLTMCTEVTNLLNERPIGSLPSQDSTLNILTPNSLLLGRATASNPLGWQPYSGSISTRYHLVQSVTNEFWKRWTELYAPCLVVQRKWRTPCRNICPGDVVIVADKNTLRGEYRLAVVKEVFPGPDGKVRKATVQYKKYRTGEPLREFRGAENVVVTRAVQRLALLVPVEQNTVGE